MNIKKAFAEVKWGTGDVLALVPNMTKERAEEFLEEHGEDIQGEMIIAGWRALEELLKQDGHMDGSDGEAALTAESRELAMPEGLSEKGQQAYKLLVDLMHKHEMTFTGGCKAFYSPAEWKARDARFCCNSELVVVYDGGHARYFCSLDWHDATLYNEFRLALAAIGCHFEEAEHWYGGVYDNSATGKQ